MTPDSIAVCYCLTDALDPVTLGTLEAVLSPDERVRGERMRFAEDRRDFIAAHGLLRRALTAAHAAVSPERWRFQTDAYGKPALAENQGGVPPLAFNLSHTRGLVACVMARAILVGIDVEIVNPAVADPDLASRCFTAEELIVLREAGPDDYAVRFAELWTLKESYIKAVGGGLSLPLDAFHFSFEAADRLRFGGAADRDDWQFVLAAPSPRTRLAVAAQSRDRALRYDYAFRNLTPRPGGAIRLLRWSHPEPSGHGRERHP